MNRISDCWRQWTSTPLDGADSVRSLADRSFSGIVEGEHTNRAFIVKGYAVGATRSFDSIVSNAKQAFHAPAPSVPFLLAALQSRSEHTVEVYTKDRPIDRAIEYLRRNDFTGYIAIDENFDGRAYYVPFLAGGPSYVEIMPNGSMNCDSDILERVTDTVGVYRIARTVPTVVDLRRDPDTFGSLSEMASSSGTTRTDTRVFDAGGSSSTHNEDTTRLFERDTLDPSGDDKDNRCRFCHQIVELDAKYCPHCGSLQ